MNKTSEETLQSMMKNRKVKTFDKKIARKIMKILKSFNEPN